MIPAILKYLILDHPALLKMLDETDDSFKTRLLVELDTPKMYLTVETNSTRVVTTHHNIQVTIATLQLMDFYYHKTREALVTYHAPRMITINCEIG
jgi:hypothetical protein